jgi:hypothetical protein
VFRQHGRHLTILLGEVDACNPATERLGKAARSTAHAAADVQNMLAGIQT